MRTYLREHGADIHFAAMFAMFATVVGLEVWDHPFVHLGPVILPAHHGQAPMHLVGFALEVGSLLYGLITVSLAVRPSTEPALPDIDEPGDQASRDIASGPLEPTAIGAETRRSTPPRPDDL